MAKKNSLEDILSSTDFEKTVAALSFEDGLVLLEELVAKVESGSLPLDQSIESYERGVKIIEKLRTMLSGAEEKLKILQKPAKK